MLRCLSRFASVATPSSRSVVRCFKKQPKVVSQPPEAKPEPDLWQRMLDQHDFDPADLETDFEPYDDLQDLSDSRYDKQELSSLEKRVLSNKTLFLSPEQASQLDDEMFAMQRQAELGATHTADREKVLTSVRKALFDTFPALRLEPFGSFANNFGFRKSDLDIAMLVHPTRGHVKKNESFSTSTVKRICTLLEKDGDFKNVTCIPSARVPIAKFVHQKTGIQCDLSVNNPISVVNTRLLYLYGQADPRVRPLGYVIKLWAKARDLNSTITGTLSSYAFIILLIHFLQHRHPPVVPCLQSLCPSASYRPVESEGDYDVYFCKDEALFRDFGRENTSSVSELLLQFFQYYSKEFDAKKFVVSIRVGSPTGHARLITKDERFKLTDRVFPLSIEDPFENVDLGRYLTKKTHKRLRDEFERAVEFMTTGRSLVDLCSTVKPIRSPPIMNYKKKKVKMRGKRKMRTVKVG